MANKILILFIHGFLGSESSFCSFPLDFIQSLRSIHRISALEAKLFPFFPTKGDPEKAINSLYNWLLLNAATAEYAAVIIVAHSMGGLIATDAFRKLMALANYETEKKDALLVHESKKSKHLSIASANVDFKDFNLTGGEGDAKEEEVKTCLPGAKDLSQSKSQSQSQSDSTASTTSTTAAVSRPRTSWFSSFWPVLSSPNKSASTPIVCKEDTLESFPVESGQDQAEKSDKKKDDTNLQSQHNSGPPKPHILGEAVVNIISIICFDSPFYGLHSTVFTKAVGDYSADIISSYVPEQHAETVNSTLKYGNDLAVRAAQSLPQATSSAVSTLFMPISDPRKAAGIIVTPIKAAPAAISSAAYSVSSAFAGVVASSFVALTEKLNVSGSSDSFSDTVTANADIPTTAATASASVTASADIATTADITDIATADITDIATADITTTDVATDTTDIATTDNIATAEIATADITSNTTTEMADISCDSAPRLTPELLPIPRDTDWSSWITLGITTAALGAGYYSGGLLAVGAVSSIARGAALAYAVPTAESGCQRLQFLYPIWGESKEASEARMQVLADQHAQGTIFARIYYLDLNAGGEVEKRRTFIAPPPDSTAHLFTKVGSDLDNEIVAHMRMFSREENPGAYWDLVHRVGLDIKDVIVRHRGGSF